MSRIDDALKIWEGTAGAATAELPATQPGDSSRLYPSEEPDRPLQDDPPRRRVVEPVEPARPVVTPRRAAVEDTEVASVKPPEDVDLVARLVTGTSNTASLEQYRRLAAVLHEGQVQNKLKTVMITSALPHEGKTLTVVNLALTLSESYARKVLVIDADLRCPSLHTILNVPNERGLSEALGEGPQELRFTAVSSHLSVLTAGKPGPTPLAGLTSSRMEEVLAECAAAFDWVLIDTSPVGVLPDAQVLVRLVGGIILVIGAGTTPAAAVTRAVEELGGPDAITGVVLNRVEEQRIAESGYYGQYRTARGSR